MVNNSFFNKYCLISFLCQKYTLCYFFENFRQPGHPGATIKGRPKRKIVAAHIKKSRLEARHFCLKLIFIWKCKRLIKCLRQTFEIFSLRPFIFILKRFSLEYKRWSPVVLSCFSSFFLTNLVLRSEKVIQVISLRFLSTWPTQTLHSHLFRPRYSHTNNRSPSAVFQANEPPVTCFKQMITIRNFVWW